MFSVKAILISTGVVFMGLGLKALVPMVMEFSASRLPVTLASLLSWLKPPYVYVIINGIIITIAASSRFHHRHHSGSSAAASSASSADRHHPYPMPSSADIPPEEFGVLEDSTVVPEVKNIAAVVMNGEEEEDEFVAPSATWTPEKEVAVSSEYLSPAEKPLVSERFGHRKPAKASPEGTILLILFFVLNSCLLIICVFLELYEVISFCLLTYRTKQLSNMASFTSTLSCFSQFPQ